MKAIGVEGLATWRRYDHYNIEYIVPNGDKRVAAFCKIHSSRYPGEEEFCDLGDSVKEVHFKTARDPRCDKEGKTIIKAECYYNWRAAYPQELLWSECIGARTEHLECIRAAPSLVPRSCKKNICLQARYGGLHDSRRPRSLDLGYAL